MSCFTNKYPYSSNRELNLDWLIAKINARKVLNLEVVENVGGGYDLVIYFADSDPVTVHLFASAEITAEDIYDLFEDSETITKALNNGKISFSAESSIYPVIYGQTTYQEASAALTAGKQLIAFYLEDNKYFQIPFKTKNVDTMNFSTVIDDIEDGKIVIRLALNQLTGWDSRIQSLLIGDDLLNIIDDTETIVADLNEDDHLEFSASYENIVQPLSRSLKTPLSAPAENKLVGFDENRDQINLGIGNGLKIENDDLELDESVLPKQSPLTFVENLPVANKTEYEKHLLYLHSEKIKYLSDTHTSSITMTLRKHNAFSGNPVSYMNSYCILNNELYFVTRSSSNVRLYKMTTDETISLIYNYPISNENIGFLIPYNNELYLGVVYSNSCNVYKLNNDTYTSITSFATRDIYGNYLLNDYLYLSYKSTFSSPTMISRIKLSDWTVEVLKSNTNSNYSPFVNFENNILTLFSNDTILKYHIDTNILDAAITTTSGVTGGFGIIKIYNDVLFIGGNGTPTEMNKLLSSSVENVGTLPYGITDSCVVYFNNTIYIIGGFLNGSLTRDIYTLSIDNIYEYKTIATETE